MTGGCLGDSFSSIVAGRGVVGSTEVGFVIAGFDIDCALLMPPLSTCPPAVDPAEEEMIVEVATALCGSVCCGFIRLPSSHSWDFDLVNG